MQITQLFQVASIGDILLNEKQKKPFLCLNNKLSEVDNSNRSVMIE